MSDIRYVSAKDTAKLVRALLKRTYPGIKFSVRTDTYAGGATVRVAWTDGPSEPEVREFTRPYAGRGFDGMIDMSYGYSAWLEPDGTAVLAETSGTEGSRGSVPSYLGAPPSEAAELVHFGASSVSTSRTVTDEFRARAYAVTERGTSDGGCVCRYCNGGIGAGEPLLLPADRHGTLTVHDREDCYRHPLTYSLGADELERIEAEWSAVYELLAV